MKALLYQLDAMTRKFVANELEQHGHHAVLSNNFEEGLGAIVKERVDAVLASAQGTRFEFIRAARRQEASGAPRAFLVALAIGDTVEARQKAAEAGADAFISIPVRASELGAVLGLAPQENRAEGSRPRSAFAKSSVPCLNLDEALERVEGDRDLLDELLRIFAEECRTSIREIRATWNARDARVLARLAHTLKGSAANLGANALSEAALALEHQARSGNLTNAESRIEDLELQIERLKPELDSFLRQGSHPS